MKRSSIPQFGNSRVTAGVRLVLPFISPLLCSPALAQTTSSPAEPIKIIHREVSPEVRAYQASLREAVPSLRCWRAPILADADKMWKTDLPSPFTGELKICSSIIARRLAADGLISTLAQVLEVLGTQRILEEKNGIIESLRSIGLPVDLLYCFQRNGAESADPYSTVTDIMRSLARGSTAAEIGGDPDNFGFRWKKTSPDFRIALDSGDEDVGSMRLQICGDKYYQAPGDGGTIDLTRQLLDALPETDFVASIEEKHVDGFLKLARDWDLKRSNRLTLLVESLPVSQWAQDNAKPGYVGAEGSRKTAVIVPRYASRWEEWSCLVPGDTFLLDSLPSQGWAVAQSPLLFQGGNLVAVHDPKTNQRILLIGESEVYRNVALGLSYEQAIEAFKEEFGVDRCVVLPAIAYHIDYEVSVRSMPSGVIAFVNDEMTASRRVLTAGLDALAEKNLVDAPTLSRARDSLTTEKPDAALATCEGILESKSVGYGQFPLAFANLFAVSASDSGVGNLQRFLLAIDVAAFSPRNATWRPPETHGEAYARSMQRRDDDRKKMRTQLEALGWKVVPVPSTSDGTRSLNYLNGIHIKNRYFMPAYGGLYATLDQEAAETFRRALGSSPPTTARTTNEGPAPVEVVPILCGESQRRYGALRCSVNVLPRTNR